MKSETCTGPALMALCPVVALRTTVIVLMRFFAPNTSSMSSERCASWVSSISAKTAPSSARSGTSASSRGRIMRTHSWVPSESLYCANVRPVLNGGSRYTQRILPANRDLELRERGEVVAVHEQVLGLARLLHGPHADSGGACCGPRIHGSAILR